MNNIQDAYINSLLADATYSLDNTTPDGIKGEALANLDALKIRMSSVVSGLIEAGTLPSQY